MFLNVTGDVFGTVGDLVLNDVFQAVRQFGSSDEVVELFIDQIRIFTTEAIAVFDDELIVVIFLTFDVATDDDSCVAANGFGDDVWSGFGHDDMTVGEEFVHVVDKIVDVDIL